MRLLIVTQAVDRNDPNLGAFYYWFEALGRKADSLVILASRTGDAHTLPQAQIHCFGGDHRRGGRLGRIWKFWKLFSHHFAHSDAVLFHQIPEFVIAASPFLLGRGRNKVAALWYAHGQVTRRLRFAERRVDYVFTSSEAGFRIPSKKVVYLGQAINTDLFYPLAGSQLPVTGNGLRLITVGRISPVKHFEAIVNAMAILHEKWPRAWTLTVVGGPITPGDYAYTEKIKGLIREKGLGNQIHFYGQRPYSEVPEILRDHDLFLNVSRTGSLDKAVLEAMACGLSVITSNEAYRTVLPLAYFLEYISPEFLAERIKALADEPRPNTALREIVVRDHALAPMIDRMTTLLNSHG